MTALELFNELDQMFKDDPSTKELKVYTTTGPGMCDSCESYCRDSENQELDFPCEGYVYTRDYKTHKNNRVKVLKLKF